MSVGTMNRAASRGGAHPPPEGRGEPVHPELHRYSLVRAVRGWAGAFPGSSGARLDGVESEVQAELARRRGAEPLQSRGGLLVPFGLAVEARALEHRDALSTVNGSGAVVRRRADVFDAIHGASQVAGLGANVTEGLVGFYDHPIVTTNPEVTWVVEGDAPVDSAPAVGVVTLSPRTAAATVTVTRRAVLMGGPAVETNLRRELAESLGEALDAAAVAGAGGKEPLGLANTPAIPVVELGADGGPPTHAALVAMERLVMEAGGTRRSGRPGCLTSPRGVETLKLTPKDAGYPVYLWEELTWTVNGYPAAASTAVPSDLAKGAGTGLSAVIFGDWTDLTVGLWGDGIEILVDPFTGQGVLIHLRAFLDCDARPRRPAERWSIIKDMVVS